MIFLDHICHGYAGDAKPVLNDVTFSIKAGECVALTGPSGCGKSTLAHIAAGHIMPSQGRVLVDGHDLTGRPSRRVFLIHQENDLFPWQKVASQVGFAMGRSDRQEIARLLRLVKLTGFEDYFPAQLSGGMKKRLALARALAVGPDLLILDESFSSLDSILKAELYDDLKRIWQATSTTILLITHDRQELANLAHREISLTTARPAGISQIITHR